MVHSILTICLVEENHRAGHRLDDIVDMRQRIGDAGVFGFAAVGIIHAAVSAHYHVFQQRIAADGAINLRLRLRIEIDGLSVAAAFEVKHAVIVPAVLIIADQLTMRIGRQGGFPGLPVVSAHSSLAKIKRMKLCES